MPCTNCFNNCSPKISDKCVEYTGVSIPILGICEGDPLSYIEDVVLGKLISALDGTGILLSTLDLDTCPHLQAILDKTDPTLVELFQVLWDNQCTLREAIEDLVDVPSSFDIKCLSGLGSSPTSDEILQAVINEVCSIKTTVGNFSSTYVKLTDLPSQVTSIINNITTSTTTTVVQYNSKLVPYVAYEYYGPLSGFDSAGKGLASAGFEKVYLCNGQNGTPDKRGRVAVGAVRSVPGGSLDAAVDPSIHPNIDYALKDKFGENYHDLTVPELPSHNHGLIDPGHDHKVDIAPIDDGRCSGGDCHKPSAPTGDTKTTQKSLTGITIQATGGGEPHENRQPSIAAYYIMFIP